MRRRDDTRGFTLLEVLAALAIVTVALMTLLSRLGVSADVVRDTRLHALALEQAENVLEELRVRPRPVRAFPLEGEAVVEGVRLHWRITALPAGVPGFVRFDARVRPEGGEAVSLFLYRFAS